MSGVWHRLADFVHEAGILQDIQRSGMPFLGSGHQSVAEHVFRTAVIGHVLAAMAGADASRVVMMCLYHDIEETRTGDLNYLQQRYVDSDDDRALADVLDGLPVADDIGRVLGEYGLRESAEAKLARDADTCELIAMLKQQLDKGNAQAQNWIDNARRRLVTDEGARLADALLATPYYNWWYGSDHDWTDGSKNW